MRKSKKVTASYTHTDIWAMLLLPLISVLLIIITRANLLVSTLIFFGVPSIYLSQKNPVAILKTSTFAFLFSAPLTFIFDYLMVKDGAWFIVDTVFSSRLFGVVAIEQFIWSFLYIFFVISVYEYFFDRKIASQKNYLISKPMIIFTLLISLLTLVMITLIFKDASLIVVPYAYVILGVTVGLIPLLLFLRHFPHFYLRFLLITLYFIFVSILVEYAGLELNQWTFPGSHYLWQFNFIGFRIPIEEFIFYFVLSTPAFLAYYEYLDDDRK